MTRQFKYHFKIKIENTNDNNVLIYFEMRLKQSSLKYVTIAVSIHKAHILHILNNYFFKSKSYQCSHSGLMNSHPLLLSKESAAGNAGGRLCPLHQPVPWLRAADADGAPIALLLHPGYHGRIQRSVTLPAGFQLALKKKTFLPHTPIPRVYVHPILCNVCV